MKVFQVPTQFRTHREAMEWLSDKWYKVIAAVEYVRIYDPRNGIDIRGWFVQTTVRVEADQEEVETKPVKQRRERREPKLERREADLVAA